MVGGQLCCLGPVGGGVAAVEQACAGEGECTGADGDDAGAAVMGGAEGVEDLDGHGSAVEARDDDRVGSAQRLEAGVGGDGESGRGLYLVRYWRGEGDAVAVVAGVAEDVGGDGQVVGHHCGQCQDHDVVWMLDVSGLILGHDGNFATGRTRGWRVG